MSDDHLTMPDEPVQEAPQEASSASATDDDYDVAEAIAAARVARIERRQAAAQRRRERRIRLGLALVGVLALALFVGGFWPVMQARLGAAKQLDQAMALLEQADNTMSGIDKTVTAQLSAEALPGVPNIAAQVLVARRELNQAVALADDATPHLTEDEQSQAKLVREAAKARLTMADSAPTILRASVKAVQAKALADQAWRLTQLATTSEAAAARNYGRQSASAVESASVAVATIQGRLADSRQLYSQAASAFPEAGFDRYIAFTDMKRREVTQLQTAAQQWLDGSRPAAAMSFAAYRASAAKSAAAARLLPQAPGNATGEGFRKVAGAASDAYARAKKQALAAEKALRER